MEHHPRLSQARLRDACEAMGVALVAYSPLGTGRLLDTEAVAALARSLGRTPAQVLQRNEKVANREIRVWHGATENGS